MSLLAVVYDGRREALTINPRILDFLEVLGAACEVIQKARK